MINDSVQSKQHRVDYVVQSMDKNFMVPVGGAVVLGSVKDIGQLQALYPGRASLSPIMDLFITLLQMGTEGLSTLLRERELLFDYAIQ